MPRPVSEPKKSDFLPIPELPCHEIDGYGCLRNSKTKQPLKPVIRSNGKDAYFTVRSKSGKRLQRTATSWRASAVAAYMRNDSFVPIPDFDDKYEVNKMGIVRNSITKRPVTVRKHKSGFRYCQLRKGGIAFSVSMSSLLWKVFGQKPPKSSKMSIPIIISKGNRTLHFDTKKACAEFLAKENSYSEIRMQVRLASDKEICGWRINRLTDDNFII